MLTPRFKLEQNENFLTIYVYAPFTNISDTEIFIEGSDFRFFSKPYFLRLHLPGEIEETDDASAVYDADTCSFVIKAPKKNQGERFEGLELLSELLKPRGETSAKEKIQVISETSTEDSESPPQVNYEDECEWYFEQEIPEKYDVDLTIAPPSESAGYGFGFKRFHVFESLLQECQEVLDVKNPDHYNFNDRRNFRVTREKEDFSSDHYLCDLFEDEEINRLCGFKATWHQDSEEEDFELSCEEREVLVTLPRKLDTKVDSDVKQSVYFGLVDILFAFLYDFRTTEGEHNSESGWTVSKLSSSLSCCEKFASLKDALLASFRRSLIYPLYRNWRLSSAVLNDVVVVLALGNVPVLKILIAVRKIFTESEGRHIFNELYINQYIVWIQSVKASALRSLSKSISSAFQKITKADLNLDLTELESAARLLIDEQEAAKTSYDSDDDSSSGSETSGSETSDSETSEASEDEAEVTDTCDKNSTGNEVEDVTSVVKTFNEIKISACDGKSNHDVKSELENLEKCLENVQLKNVCDK